MSSEDEARLRKRTAQLNLAYALISLATLAWYLTPDHQRQEAAARLRRAARPLVAPLLDAAARRAGRLAMTRELMTGSADYRLPEWLSRTRDTWGADR